MRKLLRKIYPAKRAFFSHILILLFSFFFYSYSFSYSFISDDFFYISFSSLSEIFSFQKGFYHYNPVFWGTLFVLKHIFGITPFPFHFVTIFMHVINTFLVYFLARAFAFRIKQGLLISLLFSVFFSHYEVVYWITGLNTSLMVFFYLLGILFLVSYSRTRIIYFLLLYLLSAILGFLTHEYILSLLPISFFYLFLFKPKMVGTLIIFFFPLFLFVGGISFVKMYFAQSHLIVLSPGRERIVTSFIKSFLYLFTTNPYLIDQLSKIALILSFSVLSICILLHSFYSKRRIFLLLWVISSILTFSLTSLPQARYFYLSSIPTLFLLIDLFSSSKRFLFFFSFFILLSGIIFLSEQKIHWKESSRATNETLVTLDSYSSQLRKAKKIYFLNVPDSSNTEPWKAYIFRNGLADWVSMQYGIEKTNILRLSTPEHFKEVKSEGVLSFWFDSTYKIHLFK